MPIPLVELKLSGSPCAILKGGDRQLRFIKINKFGSKYFATRDGQVFEMDDEYEYRYKKTSVYFYNFSNSKPLSLQSMSEITDVLKKAGDSELFNKHRFFTAISSDPKVDMSKIQLPDDLTEEMTPDTRRFLQDHATDDETSKTDLMVKVHTMKKPISRYSRKLLPIGINRGSFAFIQIGYKRIDVCSMYVHDNRAYTKYGVFEIDRDSIYFFNKQMICFFVISNEQGSPTPPLYKKEHKMMKTMIKNKRWKELETFHDPIKKKARGGEGLLQESLTPQMPKSVSISSEKKLIQYQADNPTVYHTTLKELHLSKEAVATKLSDPFKKAVPIVIIFAVIMGFVMLVTNIPAIVDSVAKYTNTQVKIVYMTEEEAKSQGIQIPNQTKATTTSSGISSETIIDQTPPVITVPESLVLEADNTNGMRIDYNVMVLDDIDGVLIPTCSPQRNTVVGIGEHIVRCQAIDSSGNKSFKEFPITIKVREGVKPGSIIPAIPTDRLGDILPKIPLPPEPEPVEEPEPETEKPETEETETEETETEDTEEPMPPMPME